MFEPIGTRIAAKITDNLAGKVGSDYAAIERIVYETCLEIARNSYSGDWIELPNGATYTLTFKPGRES